VARFSEEDRKTIWDMREAGVPVKRIAKHLGRQNSSLRKFIADAGGRRPTARERCALRLSLAEREEISRGLAAGRSIRAIAEGLGRSASTVCREVNVNGGRAKYRALGADRGAQRRALRPKRAKLVQCRRLRSVVERKLEALWSPQQISGWLAERYPHDPEMRVSPIAGSAAIRSAALSRLAQGSIGDQERAKVPTVAFPYVRYSELHTQRRASVSEYRVVRPPPPAPHLGCWSKRPNRPRHQVGASSRCPRGDPRTPTTPGAPEPASPNIALGCPSSRHRDVRDDDA
jgi:transposase